MKPYELFTIEHEKNRAPKCRKTIGIPMDMPVRNAVSFIKVPLLVFLSSPPPIGVRKGTLINRYRWNTLPLALRTFEPIAYAA
jgi:hypothetical protein